MSSLVELTGICIIVALAAYTGNAQETLKRARVMANIVNKEFLDVSPPRRAEWNLFAYHQGALYLKDIAVTFKAQNSVAAKQTITTKDGAAEAKLTASAKFNSDEAKLASADVTVSFTCHRGDKGVYSTSGFSVELTNIQWLSPVVLQSEDSEKNTIAVKLETSLQDKLKQNLEQALLSKEDSKKCGVITLAQ